MKKTTQDFISSDNESKVEKNIIEDDKVKTTNVNILLNRVRLNQKSESRKKIYFSTAASTALILFGFLIF